MARKSWISFFAATFLLPLFWSLIVVADPAKEPTLQVQIRNGEVVVGEAGTDLNAEQLQALQQGLTREMNRAPFQRGGSVDLVIKGERLNELSARLASIDISNTDEVDKVVAQTWPPTGEAVADQTPGTVAVTEDDTSRVLIGQNFLVAEDEKVDSLVAIGGTGDIRGEVGTLVAIGSTIDVASSARVVQDLVSLGSVIRKHPGSEVTAQEVTVALPAWASINAPEEWAKEAAPVTLGGILFTFIVSYLIALGLGYLYLRFFPDLDQNVEAHLRANRGSSFGYGVLAQLLVIPGAALLVVSIVGILLLPFYLTIYGLFMFLGYITVAHMIGSSILKSRGTKDLATLALGLFILELVRLVPVLGWLIVFCLAVAGFGAVAVTAWHRFQNYRSAPPTQPGPQPDTWVPAPSL